MPPVLTWVPIGCEEVTWVTEAADVEVYKCDGETSDSFEVSTSARVEFCPVVSVGCKDGIDDGLVDDWSVVSLVLPDNRVDGSDNIVGSKVVSTD